MQAIKGTFEEVTRVDHGNRCLSELGSSRHRTNKNPAGADPTSPRRMRKPTTRRMARGSTRNRRRKNSCATTTTRCGRSPRKTRARSRAHWVARPTPFRAAERKSPAASAHRRPEINQERRQSGQGLQDHVGVRLSRDAVTLARPLCRRIRAGSSMPKNKNPPRRAIWARYLISLRRVG